MESKERKFFPSQAAVKVGKAYHEANRLIVAAGLTLAAAGVRKDAPELEALRLALRAVNAAGGVATRPVHEASTIGRKEKPHGYPGVNGPRFGGPGKVA